MPRGPITKGPLPTDLSISRDTIPWLVVMALLLCLLIASAALGRPAPQPPTPTPTPTPVPLTSLQSTQGRGRLAYYSDGEGGAIMVADFASGEIGRLTWQPGFYDGLAWSPDGTTLVYTESTSSGDALFAQRVDGQSAPLELTKDRPSSIRDFALSPDGTRVVFTADGDRGPVLFQVGVDGSGLGPLKPGAGASWSPGPSEAGDGTQIVYTVADTRNTYLSLLRMDGPSNPVKLTGPDTVDHSPAWSPTGEWIVYLDGYYPVLIHPDGSGQRAVNNDLWNIVDMAWSPDGARIAFSGGTGTPVIMVVNVDGSGLRQLTTEGDDRYGDRRPVWSPDGRQIAFVSTRGGNTDIYVVNADGTGLARLTDDLGVEDYPAWSK